VRGSALRDDRRTAVEYLLGGFLLAVSVSGVHVTAAHMLFIVVGHRCVSVGMGDRVAGGSSGFIGRHRRSFRSF